MLPTANGAAALSPHPMAPPLPPNSTNGTTATVSSLPLSPRVSEVTDKKPAEADPFGEKPPDSSEKPGEKNASDQKLPKGSSDEKAEENTSGEKPPHSSAKPDGKKNASGANLAKDLSDDKFLQLIVRLDPSGFLCVLCLVSILVLSWRFWCLFNQPLDQFWNTSLLLCLLLFLWTISVSDSPKMVILGFSYILLLSCAATHLIGQINGMLVMYIGTLYAAGLLGYTISGYCQRLRIGKSALSLVIFKAKGQKHNEVGASLVCSLISMCSLVFFARITWLVLAPDMSHGTFFEAFDYVIEMWTELCGSVGFWIIYITQFDLGGAIVSMDTLAWAVPCYLGGGLLIGISLFLAIGDAMAILFFWIGTMALMGFFGYILALRAIIASCHPSTKWEQRSDKVYLTIELAGVKDVMLNMKPDGHFNFSAKGHDEVQYELHLELFGAINVEESKVAVVPGTICYLIKKAESNWWPRLFKKEGKPPVFLKVDLDKWQDEDDEDTESDDFGDMVFMELDKGGDDEDYDSFSDRHNNGEESVEE